MLILVDYDGTLIREVSLGGEHVLRDGAEEMLRGLKRAEHVLILHSTRCQAPINDEALLGRLYPGGVIPAGMPKSVRESLAYFREMRDFLRGHKLWTVKEGGVFDVVWQQPGKPHADLALDDRAINMRARDACWRVLREYGGAA